MLTDIKLTDPIWMGWAIHEATDGIVEEPNHDNRGPVIERYIKLAKCGHLGDPYCAVAVNAALEFNNIKGSRSAAARSFEWNTDDFVKLTGPAYGAITVFWRGSHKSGTGHVGFYVGETENHVYTLGANQHDDFNQSPFPKDGISFGLVGHYWPKTIKLPLIQRIKLSGNGKPISTKVT